MFRRVSAVLLVLAAAAVAAQTPKESTKPVPSRAEGAARTQRQLAMPRGPIKITAEHAELEKRERALYRGNVRLVSPDVELTGDRLELKQPSKGQFEAHLSGRPARLKHKGQGDLPPVAASAAQIFYDTRRATIDLTGGAQLERGTDLIKSETIRYDLGARRISASGVGDGQVQIIIQAPANGALGTRRPNALPQNPQNTPAHPDPNPE